MQQKVTRGDLRDQKKIKDKKQIKPAMWGLTAALNSERKRDIVIQPFLSPGRVADFRGAVWMGAEAWWGAAGSLGGDP